MLLALAGSRQQLCPTAKLMRMLKQKDIFHFDAKSVHSTQASALQQRIDYFAAGTKKSTDDSHIFGAFYAGNSRKEDLVNKDYTTVYQDGLGNRKHNSLFTPSHCHLPEFEAEFTRSL